MQWKWKHLLCTIVPWTIWLPFVSQIQRPPELAIIKVVDSQSFFHLFNNVHWNFWMVFLIKFRETRHTLWDLQLVILKLLLIKLITQNYEKLTLMHKERGWNDSCIKLFYKNKYKWLDNPIFHQVLYGKGEANGRWW